MTIDPEKILTFLDRVETSGACITVRELTLVLRARITDGSWDAES